MRYILIISLILSLSYSTGCKKDNYPESPLQFDSLDESGGNLARFTIIGNYLCAVNGSNIKVYNIQLPANPMQVGNMGPGATILSLRTLQDSLLVIGTVGMYSPYALSVYNFKPNQSLQLLGALDSSQANDPFTFGQNYLFTSEHAGASSSYYVQYSQMFAYNIKKLNASYYYNNPDYKTRKNIYSPLDLSADGDNLFVCDSGLKVFDITNVAKITLKKHFNIEAQNVLSNNGNLTILGPTGLFQYQYATDTVSLLSKINIVHSP